MVWEGVTEKVTLGSCPEGGVLQRKEEPGKGPKDRQPLARWGPGKEVVGRCGEDHGGHLKALALLGVRLRAVGRW